MNNLSGYSILLFGVLSTFLLSSVVSTSDLKVIALPLLSLLVLVGGLLAVWKNKHLRVVKLLGVTAIVVDVITLMAPGVFPTLISQGAKFPFLLLITGIVFEELLHSKQVDGDTIVGAICGYFLMGLTFGCLYELIEIVKPLSFHRSHVGLTAQGHGSPEVELFYFSFITMTTVGFGDIVPLHPIARSLAMLQGVAGQMYVAILVAKLVSMYSREQVSND